MQIEPEYVYDDGEYYEEIEIEIPPAFEFLFTPSRYKVAYGGRDSGKSTQFALVLLLLGCQERCRILCTREYQSKIKYSVKNLLDSLIKKYNMDSYKSLQSVIINEDTGTEIIFEGLQNIESIKSMDEIKYCWVEEGANLTQNSIDILLPTIRAKDSEIWFSFNTGSVSDAVYQTFVIEGRPNSIVRKINYDENPFFDENHPNYQEMMYDKLNRPIEYNHIWLGEPEQLIDSIVFKERGGHKYFIVKEFETPKNIDQFYYGLDFGFEDPVAFIRCYIDSEQKLIYVDRADTKVHCKLDYIPAFIETIQKGASKEVITADHAKPETIEFLERNGLPNIRKAKKGQNSIDEGIVFLKNYTIIVHPKLDKLIYELSNYSFQVDKASGLIKPGKYVDKDNHLIDALRYAVEPLRKPISTFKMAGYNN